MRFPWPLALAALLAAALAGCRAECRNLCSDWYDYRRDFCGEFDSNDERVQCVADYKAVVVTDAERRDCAERSAQIADLREADDACLCEREPEDCLPGLGGDDDSGAE